MLNKKIGIVTIALMLLVSGCISGDKPQDEAAKESDAGNGISSSGDEEISSAATNSSPDNQSVNESINSEQVPQYQVVVPPHTATEIVYQSSGDGNYLLLNTTEKTYFVNQTGTKDDYGGSYSETSQTYNLDTSFGTTTVFVKENNGVSFEADDGGRGFWERVD
ncbi:hypothetical protein DU55_13065 [Methanosarcina mazei]|uniref:Uncharacterized protein n=1 Tax=Methanosarcina mazei TaxID=2209 RepID=A0A0F8KG94_METMZ|nr:hypothetical protein DU55_13065 [Methanosarcina mazei]